MRRKLASVGRDHPLLTACLLVAAGAGVGYAAAGQASGKLNDTLLVASTTLVFGALLGGVVKFLLEDLQRLRERRADDAQFAKQMLDDLKSIYDRVERVKILIAAHQSALTYGSEMRDLIDSAVQLRNVSRALDQTSGDANVHQSDLKLGVERMTAYLDSLTGEFQRSYKSIADKQAVYEARAKRAREAEPPTSPPDNEAWDEICRLPRLAEFLGEGLESPFDYDRDFGKALDLATWILRAELKRLVDGSTLKMPEEHATSRHAIATESTNEGAATN